jgi:preprotein translocase subunit YajC
LEQLFPLLAQAANGPNGLQNLILPIGMGLIFYLLLWRPHKAQQKQHRELLSGLKKGDDVVTQGGMLGKIYAVTDQVVTLEVSNGVRIRVLKSSIQGRTKADEPVLATDKTEKPSSAKEEK